MYTKTPTDSQARHDASPLAELWVIFFINKQEIILISAFCE